MRLRITSLAQTRTALAGALLLCVMGPQGFVHGTAPMEPETRATEAKFLYNIAEFVNWPVESGPNAMNFCILGSDPFGGSLEKNILGHPIDGRRTVVVRGRRIEDLGACNVLFISPSEALHQSQILESVRGKRILTAGETSNFAASGGMVQFVREGRELKFLINLDAAKRAGLKIDSKLLALAAVVYDSPK